jgi:hypothetical protein
LLLLKPHLATLDSLRNPKLVHQIDPAVFLEGDHQSLRLARHFLFESGLAISGSRLADKVANAIRGAPA